MPWAPPFPPGWDWHFECTTERWTFIYGPSGWKQSHFPREGDERGGAAAFITQTSVQATQVVSAASNTDVRTSTAFSAQAKYPAVQQPVEMSTDREIVSMTATMAAISVEPQSPIPSIVSSAGSMSQIKRKALGSSGSQSTVSPITTDGQLEQMSHVPPTPSSVVPSLPTSPTPRPHVANQAFNVPPEPAHQANAVPLATTQPPMANSTASVSSISASTSASLSSLAGLQPTPQTSPPAWQQHNAPLYAQRHASVPLVNAAHLQPHTNEQRHPSLPTMPQAQIQQHIAPPAPHGAQIYMQAGPQPSRPELQNTTSAPVVMQATPTANMPQPQGQPSTQANGKRQSVSGKVGNWMNRNPTLTTIGAVAGVVAIEAAGLSQGVDLSKGVRSVSRITQQVKNVKKRSQAAKLAQAAQQPATVQNGVHQNAVFQVPGGGVPHPHLQNPMPHIIPQQNGRAVHGVPHTTHPPSGHVGSQQLYDQAQQFAQQQQSWNQYNALQAQAYQQQTMNQPNTYQQQQPPLGQQQYAANGQQTYPQQGYNQSYVGNQPYVYQQPYQIYAPDPFVLPLGQQPTYNIDPTTATDPSTMDPTTLASAPDPTQSRAVGGTGSDPSQYLQPSATVDPNSFDPSQSFQASGSGFDGSTDPTDMSQGYDPTAGLLASQEQQAYVDETIDFTSQMTDQMTDQTNDDIANEWAIDGDGV